MEAGYTVGRCRSSGLAHQTGFGRGRSTTACGQRPRYTSAGKNGSGRGLLSVWMDRQCSNKLECHVAKARRVLMAHGLAGAPRKELKDKQLLSLCTELRSNRLNRSGMNKIVRSRSATPWSIKRSDVHVQTCNRCSDTANSRLVVHNPFCSGCNI